MQLKMIIRYRLVVEHNMCTLIEAYRSGTSLSNEADLQIQFIDFLTEFNKEEVEHGISYIKKIEPRLYNMLLPLILEYRTYGLAHLEEGEGDGNKEHTNTSTDNSKEGLDKDKGKGKFNFNLLHKLNSLWCRLFHINKDINKDINKNIDK